MSEFYTQLSSNLFKFTFPSRTFELRKFNYSCDLDSIKETFDFYYGEGYRIMSIQDFELMYGEVSSDRESVLFQWLFERRLFFSSSPCFISIDEYGMPRYIPEIKPGERCYLVIIKDV